MEPKVNIEMHIGDQPLLHFNSVKITQSFNHHHEFEVILNQDVIEETGSFKIDQSKSWVGQDFILSLDHGAMDFKGIVCEVGLEQSHGYRGNLVITGYSPTILLEGGGQINSFNETTLKDIVQQVSKNLPSGSMDVRISPAYQEEITYLTQFKESNYAFINRLSAEYGEFFYYDGKVLHFGKPDQQKEVKLIHGQNLNVMKTSIRMKPLGFTYYSYHSSENEILDSQPGNGSDSLNDYAKTGAGKSDEMYSEKANVPVKPRVSNKNQLDILAAKHAAAAAADLSNITGESTSTSLNLGSLADVNVSRKDLQGLFKQDELGQYLITEITHQLDGVGRYLNSFRGVSGTANVLPVPDAVRPQAESQVAIVKDNNDPLQIGRVKVQMLWQKDNSTTDWIRVLTPDGGSSDSISKNRGYVFIPEIGDQVILGFRYNDPDRPFVLGSVFQGNTGAGGFAQNHLKSLTTRTGHLIEFDDNSSSQGIKITDMNNNVIHIDTVGNNITISALENISINAKNIFINAEQNITTIAGMNIDTSAGENMSDNAGRNMTKIATSDYSVMASNITEVATEAFNTEATNISKTAAGDLSYGSTGGSVTTHADKLINNNSGEKSNLH